MVVSLRQHVDVLQGMPLEKFANDKGLVLQKSKDSDVDMESLLPTDMDVRRFLELATKDEMLGCWIRKMLEESIPVLRMKTPQKSDHRWHSGVNGQNKSRTYRVVAPLWYWKDIFRKADLSHFLTHAGVRMMRELLKEPEYVIYFVRSRGLDPVDWNEVGKTFVEIKTVEVGSNYTESMERFQIQQKHFEDNVAMVQREGLARGVLDQWIDLMCKSSSYYFQGRDVSSPWLISCPDDMPVVCWIRKLRPHRCGNGV